MKNAIDKLWMLALQTDINANIIYCNDYFLEFTGWTMNEIIGSNWFDKFYPAHLAQDAKSAFTKAIKEGNLNTHFEGRIVTRNNEVREIFWNDTLLKDNNGNPQGIISFGEDVTERKRLQKSLKLHEKRLNLAIEAGKIGLFEVDLVHRTSWRSLRHDRIFGYETLLPVWTLEMLIEHVIPEDRAAVTRKTREATTNSSGYDFQCRIKRKDGVIRWIWAKCDPEFNKKNEIVKLVGVVKDISEWKKAQEALKDSELKFRRFFESNKDGMFIVDAESGQIEDANPFMRDLLGYTQREFVSKKFWEIGSLKNTIANQKFFMELQQKEYTVFRDLPLETKDGQMLYAEFTGTVYLVGARKMIQCNVRNVSNRPKPKKS